MNPKTGASGSSTLTASEEEKPVETWICQPPLMTLFKAPLNADAAIKQEAKEKQWELHFAEYGRGVTIYRTVETAKLVIQGVPQSLRGEVWLTFSGKTFSDYFYFNFLILPIPSAFI